jgi:hypothetical protein
MAFRTKAKTCAGLIVFALSGFAASPQSYDVRHLHLRHGGPGVLRIDDSGITFTERGKQAKHSRAWKYDDIQELVLGTQTVRIVTYEDNRWQLGRDRVYVFDKLPASLAADWYPIFRTRLDARFVAALADGQVSPEWQVPAKLAHGRSGSNGVLLVGADRVVYKSEQPGESRTWRISDLDNVSSSDAFDLTLVTHEATFRFQLKQALPDQRLQALWTRVNQTRGLQILSSGDGRHVHPD